MMSSAREGKDERSIKQPEIAPRGLTRSGEVLVRLRSRLSPLSAWDCDLPRDLEGARELLRLSEERRGEGAMGKGLAGAGAAESESPPSAINNGPRRKPRKDAMASGETTVARGRSGLALGFATGTS